MGLNKMVNNLVAVVSTSEEDKIEVETSNHKQYVYSFYSKGRQEFSKEIVGFPEIEKSILGQFPITGQSLVDNIKRQLRI